jgi:hypothetical protein
MLLLTLDFLSTPAAGVVPAVAESERSNMSHPLYAGVARQEITPPLGTLLMGYPDPQGKRRATAVRDPLNATALALAGDEGRAILLTLDLGVIEDAQVQQIRDAIEARTGIPGSCITVSTSQTHSAPCTQRVFGWCELDMPYIERILIPGAAQAAVQAASLLVPVRVGFAETHSDVGVNRRAINRTDLGMGMRQNLWGIYDPTMTVLRFQGPDGPLANIVHYGAHPTVLGSASKVISRDWPGVMIDRVEQLTKATTLYFNGAVGDIAPRTNSMGATGDNTEAALWEAGAAAAMDAMRAWRSIRDLRDVPLVTHSETFDIPYRPLTPLDEAKQNLAQWEPRKNEPGAPMCEYKHWQAVIEEHQRTPRTGKPFMQVITAIGPAAFVPIPGEPFGETVLRIREFSPYQHTLALSTSCGNNAYIFTRESIHRGGYEVWVNRALGPYLLAEGVDDVIAQKNYQMLGALHKRTHPPLPRVQKACEAAPA